MVKGFDNDELGNEQLSNINLFNRSAFQGIWWFKGFILLLLAILFIWHIV